MKNEILLERIQVKNLFNRFTYDINVKNGYNVAILIAPNGCGKTTVFNMVDFIFRPTIAKFRKISFIPFESCLCTMSNGKTVGLEIRKAKKGKKKDDKMLRPLYAVGMGMGLGRLEAEGKVLFLTVNDGEEHELNLSDAIRDAMRFIDDDDLPFPDAYTDRFIEYMDIDDLALREMSPRMRRMMMQSSMGLNTMTEFREKYGCKLDINFISADRLHRQSGQLKNGGSYARPRGYEEREMDPLSLMQEKVKELYTKTDAEYKKLVSEARDRLPKMFLSNHNKTKMSFEEFEKSWKEYVSDMEKYYQLGLLESTQTILESSKLEKSFKDNGAFLSVYLEAFKSTLEPWNREYERMKLLADILNRRNRVTCKTLKYGPDGLIISVDDQKLPLGCLSSGEKNDLIMFYNLIFNSEKGGLVLVDEPEISLHIEWQEEYLDCLLSICEMNELQAIVATHSPNIVNGHFELYAERGLQDERR